MAAATVGVIITKGGIRHRLDLKDIFAIGAAIADTFIIRAAFPEDDGQLAIDYRQRDKPVVIASRACRHPVGDGIAIGIACALNHNASADASMFHAIKFGGITIGSITIGLIGCHIGLIGRHIVSLTLRCGVEEGRGFEMRANFQNAWRFSRDLITDIRRNSAITFRAQQEICNGCRIKITVRQRTVIGRVLQRKIGDEGFLCSLRGRRQSGEQILNRSGVTRQCNGNCRRGCLCANGRSRIGCHRSLLGDHDNDVERRPFRLCSRCRNQR